MSAGGWLIMILSVGSVTLLLLWCIWKLVTTPEQQEQSVHGFKRKGREP